MFENEAVCSKSVCHECKIMGKTERCQYKLSDYGDQAVTSVEYPGAENIKISGCPPVVKYTGKIRPKKYSPVEIER